jgi:hypothetical protein
MVHHLQTRSVIGQGGGTHFYRYRLGLGDLYRLMRLFDRRLSTQFMLRVLALYRTYRRQRH